jgi:hypothetical protein
LKDGAGVRDFEKSLGRPFNQTKAISNQPQSEGDTIMSDKDFKAGQDWARQHPNMPPPPKSNPDFAAGVNSTKK